jgi:DNA-binding HxlR family transcriptional regulator
VPKKSEPACPVEITLNVIGGRWKPVVLYHLFAGTLRYSDLQRAIPRITPKMLTQQLRDLERDGVVKRNVFPEVPPRVEYSMTPLGATLRPAMQAMCQWAKEYERTRPERRVICMPDRPGKKRQSA